MKTTRIDAPSLRPILAPAIVAECYRRGREVRSGLGLGLDAEAAASEALDAWLQSVGVTSDDAVEEARQAFHEGRVVATDADIRLGPTAYVYATATSCDVAEITEAGARAALARLIAEGQIEADRYDADDVYLAEVDNLDSPRRWQRVR